MELVLEGNPVLVDEPVPLVQSRRGTDWASASAGHLWKATLMASIQTASAYGVRANVT